MGRWLPPPLRDLWSASALEVPASVSAERVDARFLSVRRAMVMRLIAAGALLSLFGAVMIQFAPYSISPRTRWLMTAVYLLHTLAYLPLHWVAQRSLSWAVVGAAAAATALVLVKVTLTGAGLSTPMFGFLLFSGMLAAGAGRPVHGAWIVLISTACAALIGWLQLHGALAAPAPEGLDALWVRLSNFFALFIAGWVAGLYVRRMVLLHYASALEREERFATLLSMAADLYWEADLDGRIVRMERSRARQHSNGSRPLPDTILPGDVRLQMDADSAARREALLQEGQAFLELPARWVRADGSVLHLRVSGQPRRGSRGEVEGVWGVARDVTREVEAEQALADTQRRYRHLFDAMPTALMISRGGRLVEANHAAQDMLGDAQAAVHNPPAGAQGAGTEAQPATAAADSVALPRGTDVLALIDHPDQAVARACLEDVTAQAGGTVGPVHDLHVRALDGRRFAVRCTSVRVDLADGPAVLSILVDDTERQAATEVLQRSEALLSHLFAMNPDIVTLSDAETERFALVNASFERLTGWRASEAVGRTMEELRLWTATERAAVRDMVMGGDGPRGLRLTVRNRYGQPLALQISAARFTLEQRSFLVVNARDISQEEQARMERAAILDTASTGIALMRSRRFVVANPRLEAMLGWPQGQLVGADESVVWPQDTGPIDLPRAASAGEAIQAEHWLQRRDGSRFLARITVSRIGSQRLPGWVGQAPADAVVGARSIGPASASESGSVWIVEDITGQRQAEEALQRARDAAETANRAKSAFLANTSHELRTPLHAMIGLARLASEPTVDEALRRQYLAQITESAQSLTDVVSDILDLSKIESGKLMLQQEPFDLRTLLRKLGQLYAMLAQAKGLEFQMDLGEAELGPVLGDALRVRQILGNYLNNALKFTQRGEIRLRARRIGAERVRFEVEDTGPGFTDAVRQTLFQPFTQADQTTTRRFGGTGLGLSICRELAELMDGAVGVESQPGIGSVFWAELALPALPRNAGRSATAVGPGGDDAAEGLPAVPVEPLPDLTGVRVLLVEDNPVNMLIGVAMLQQWGVVVEQAVHGEAALEAVARAEAEGRLPDLVLMDVQMPVMSGYEATRRLRQRHAPDELPIMALTAAALVDEREAARACGMNDFVTKPIDPDRLRASVARWYRRPAQR